MRKADPEFLETWLTYALVVRGPLGEIEKLKRFVADSGLRVIYQTTDSGRLWISRRPEGGRKHG